MSIDILQDQETIVSIVLPQSFLSIMVEAAFSVFFLPRLITPDQQRLAAMVYYPSIYFRYIRLQMIRWFLIYLLRWNDRILIYQI